MTDTKSSVLMRLGNFKFSLSSAAYQRISRESEYRWDSTERIGRRPGLQYIGPGSERITLPGDIYPEYAGGWGQLEAMRTEAAQGAPLLLVDGRGLVHGLWVIIRVSEVQSYFSPDGTPRKMSFELQLSRYGEDEI